MASSASAIATAWSLAMPFALSGASIRFSSTDMCGHRLKCWNTMPMSERTARAAALVCRSGSGVEIAVPCMRMRPSLGFSSSARQRSKVVLPEPDGPTTQTTSRSITGSETRVSNLVRAETLGHTFRQDDRRSRHRPNLFQHASVSVST